MKSRIALLAILSAFTIGQAQNLVPNPSFESVVTPPCSWLTAASQLPAAVTNWTMPSDGSTDIFSDYVANTCYAHNFSVNASAIGQQAPRTGRVQSALLTYGAGCGSMPNYREYLQVQLTSPMISGQTYDFEFWLSMADNSNTATNNFGVHFRTSSYFQATCFVIGVAPQFNSTTIITNKTSWVRVNGTITATANWSHIILGNFYSNAATSTQAVGGSAANARYFIDDISVTPAVVLSNPALTLEATRMENGAVELNWNTLEILPADGFSVQRSTDGSVWETVQTAASDAVTKQDPFAPNTRLHYRLRYTDEAGQSFSSETVMLEAVKGIPYQVVVGPNPSMVGQPANIRIANADETEAVLQVLDINGRKLWQSESKRLIDLDNSQIPTDMFKPGMYFLHLQTQNNMLATTRWTLAE